MRHQKRKRNLGMSPSHRSSLLVNLAASILDKERIVTILAKAKEVRGTVERLITYGKRGGLHAMRLAARAIQNKDLLHKLFTDIAPSFKEREGGYTRIIKIGERKGDNAMTVFIELVGRSAGEIARMRKKQKKQQAGQPDVKAPKSETPAQSTEAPAPQKEPKAKKEKPESKKKESVKAKKPKESAAAGHEKKEAPAAEKPEKPAKAKKTEPAKKKKADKE